MVVAVIAGVVFNLVSGLKAQSLLANVAEFTTWGRLAAFAGLYLMVWPLVKTLDHLGGSSGLEELQNFFVKFFVGAGAVGAVIILFSTVGTSTAEGGAVVVEVQHQIQVFQQLGHFEAVGGTGYVTTSASAVWNAIVFPALLMLWLSVHIGYRVFFAKSTSDRSSFIARNTVVIDRNQVVVGAGFACVIAYFQFVFSLDGYYSFAESVSMVIFMLAFLGLVLTAFLPIFKQASHEHIEDDPEDVPAKSMREIIIYSPILLVQKYFKLANWLGKKFAQTLMFNLFHPWKETALNGEESTRTYVHWAYFALRVLQFFLSMFVVMSILIVILLTVAIQAKAGDVETSLFGTAFLTSVPELLAMLSAGVVLSVVLLYGSNIVDAGFSAMGFCALSIYSFFQNGGFEAIELDPSVPVLSFLVLVASLIAGMSLFASSFVSRDSGKGLLMQLGLLGVLLGLSFGFYSLALTVAQAFGGAQWALSSDGFQMLRSLVDQVGQVPHIDSISEVVLGIINLLMILTMFQPQVIQNWLVKHPSIQVTSRLPFMTQVQHDSMLDLYLLILSSVGMVVSFGKIVIIMTSGSGNPAVWAGVGIVSILFYLVHHRVDTWIGLNGK